MGATIQERTASKGRSPLRQIFYGSLWYGLSVAVGRVSPALMTVILAWWLDPRDLGVISFVLAYYSVLLGVADWSITYSLQKLMPEYRDRAGEVAWTALVVRFGSSTVLGLLCWGVDKSTGVLHGYGGYLALLLVASSFGTIAYVHNARCRFAASGALSIGFQVGWVVLALVLVKAGMTIAGPLLALCLSFALIGIPGFLMDSALRKRMAFLRSAAKEVLHFGLWATVATLLGALADQIGVLIVAYANGDAAAGVFRVAATFAMAPGLLGAIVTLPLMPVAKRSLLNGEDLSAGLVRPVLRYLLLVGLPLAAAGIVLAPAVIRTLVRESYVGAIWPMRILLGAGLLRMVVSALSGVLFVGQGLKALAKIHGTVVAIGLAVSLLVVRSWGITGVAGALLAAWTAGALLLYRWFHVRTPLWLEWGKYLRYVASAAVMAMAAFWTAKVLHPPVEQLVFGGAVATIVYGLLLWAQGDSAFESFSRILGDSVSE